MSKNYLALFGLFIALMAVLIIPSISFAQTSNLQTITNTDLSISPSNPKFGDTITATLANVYKNLNTATISWYVDENLKKEGIGITSFSFDLSKKTNAVTIKAIISSTDFKDTVTQTIQPADVDLIFEPQSYAPYFYKGSPLFITMGTVKILAVPIIVVNGVKIPSNQLTYTWNLNGIINGDASGRGKNTFVFSGNGIDNDSDVEVTVTDDSKKVTANKSMSISASNPSIMIYEDNPAYGLFWNNALVGNVNIGSKEEIDIMAFPFNFDVKNADDSALTMDWTVNGQSYAPPAKKNAIALKQVASSGSGSANVGLSVANNARIFQFGSFNFTLSYAK